MKLFLDDIRCPSECTSYMHQRISELNPIYLEGKWFIVRNYNEFIEAIITYSSKITHVSFDHDLADAHYHETMEQGELQYEEYLRLSTKEKTGYECALFMKQYYDENNLKLPVIFIHSMNPVGVERIKKVFN